MSAAVADAGRFAWERALRDDDDLPWETKAVGLLLATFMDADGGNCFPSVGPDKPNKKRPTSLVTRTGQDQATIRRHLARLEAAGWIETSDRPGKSSRRVPTIPASHRSRVPQKDSHEGEGGLAPTRGRARTSERPGLAPTRDNQVSTKSRTTAAAAAPRATPDVSGLLDALARDAIATVDRRRISNLHESQIASLLAAHGLEALLAAAADGLSDDERHRVGPWRLIEVWRRDLGPAEGIPA